MYVMFAICAASRADVCIVVYIYRSLLAVGEAEQIYSVFRARTAHTHTTQKRRRPEAILGFDRTINRNRYVYISFTHIRVCARELQH